MAYENLDIVLASASPRRRTLLKEAGIDFRAIAVDVDESLEPDQLSDPIRAAQIVAERKARAAVEQLLTPDYAGTLVVIGSDTMVVLDGEIFGKPTNEEHAAKMLRRLSGRTHQVVTAVSLWAVHAPEEGDIDLGFRTITDVANVRFRSLSEDDIAAYIATGDPMDKAGAYGLQTPVCDFVAEVEGDRNTVIGLPVQKVCDLLDALA